VACDNSISLQISQRHRQHPLGNAFYGTHQLREAAPMVVGVVKRDEHKHAPFIAQPRQEIVDRTIAGFVNFRAGVFIFQYLPFGN
jgi:hypothetical protein